MRRLAIATAIIVAIVAVAWTGGWFALAAWAERNAASVLTRLEERGIAVRCEDRDIVGYPFALRIACGETEVVERNSGSRASLAGVTGGASVFAPRTARIEFDDPVDVESPLVPGPAEFRWDEAAVEVGLGVGGPRAVGFDAAGFAAESPAGAALAEHAKGSLAPTEDGGSLAQLSFRNLALTIEGADYPPLDGSVAARLSVPPRALLAGRAGLRAPLAVRDLQLMLANGEARLQAGGDIEVDAEGVLDGTVTLRLAGAEGLGTVIAGLPPEARKAGNALAGAMLAFGRPTEIDGEPASELTIEIERGRAKVGMFETDLPRLRL